MLGLSSPKGYESLAMSPTPRGSSRRRSSAFERLGAVREAQRVRSMPPSGPGGTASELAAWTMIGNIVLNLDEVITKG